MITYGSDEDLGYHRGVDQDRQSGGGGGAGGGGGGRRSLLRSSAASGGGGGGGSSSVMGCTRSSCTSTGSGSNGSSSASNGGPGTVYSREEFKEHYCITTKELEALDIASRNRGLFSCLSNKQESSCSRGSLLSSCVKRKSYEECVDEDKRPYVKLKPTSEWRGSTTPTSGGPVGVAVGVGVDDELLGAAGDPYFQQQRFASGTLPLDPTTAESYFRRRPKTVCLSDPTRFHYPPAAYQMASQDTGIRVLHASKVGKPGDSTSSGWNSSLDSDEGAPAAIMRSSFGIRYGPLPPASSSDFAGGPGDFSSLKSIRHIDGQGVGGGSGIRRTGLRGGHDPSSAGDERRPSKHVSFDSSSLLRSQTVGSLDTHVVAGGISGDLASLRAVGNGRALLLQHRAGQIQQQQLQQQSQHQLQAGVPGGRPLNSSIKATSQERLIDGKKTVDLGSCDRSLDSHMTSCTKALVKEKIKKSAMKTQATQTETDIVGVVKSVPPPYLSLSPRRSLKIKKKSCSAQTNGGPGHRKLVKSLSEMGQFEDIQMKIYDLDTGLVRSREFILPPPIDFECGGGGVPGAGSVGPRDVFVVDGAEGSGGEEEDDDEVDVVADGGGVGDEEEDDEDGVGTGHREYREIKKMKEYQEIFIDFMPSYPDGSAAGTDLLQGRQQEHGLARPVIPVETEYYFRSSHHQVLKQVDGSRKQNSLVKTLSEGDMLSTKRQGFSLPTGFCDVDLDRVKSEPEQQFVERYFADSRKSKAKRQDGAANKRPRAGVAAAATSVSKAIGDGVGSDAEPPKSAPLEALPGGYRRHGPSSAGAGARKQPSSGLDSGTSWDDDSDEARGDDDEDGFHEDLLMPEWIGRGSRDGTGAGAEQKSLSTGAEASVQAQPSAERAPSSSLAVCSSAATAEASGSRRSSDVSVSGAPPPIQFASDTTMTTTTAVSAAVSSSVAVAVAAVDVIPAIDKKPPPLAQQLPYQVPQPQARMKLSALPSPDESLTRTPHTARKQNSLSSESMRSSRVSSDSELKTFDPGEYSENMGSSMAQDDFSARVAALPATATASTQSESETDPLEILASTTRTRAGGQQQGGVKAVGVQKVTITVSLKSTEQQQQQLLTATGGGVEEDSAATTNTGTTVVGGRGGSNKLVSHPSVDSGDQVTSCSNLASLSEHSLQRVGESPYPEDEEADVDVEAIRENLVPEPTGERTEAEERSRDDGSKKSLDLHLHQREQQRARRKTEQIVELYKRCGVTLIPESGESTERESVGSTGSKTVTFDDEIMITDSPDGVQQVAAAVTPPANVERLLKPGTKPQLPLPLPLTLSFLPSSSSTSTPVATSPMVAATGFAVVTAASKDGKATPETPCTAISVRKPRAEELLGALSIDDLPPLPPEPVEQQPESGDAVESPKFKMTSLAAEQDPESSSRASWSRLERQKARKELTLDLEPDYGDEHMVVLDSSSGERRSPPATSGVPGAAATAAAKTSQQQQLPPPPPVETAAGAASKRWDDIPRRKDRRKIVSTSLGMVRSPAMHEGFRKELFTVERSPGTPIDVVISSSSSSESEEEYYRAEERRRRRNGRKKSKSKSNSRDSLNQTADSAAPSVETSAVSGLTMTTAQMPPGSVTGTLMKKKKQHHQQQARNGGGGAGAAVGGPSSAFAVAPTTRGTSSLDRRRKTRRSEEEEEDSSDVSTEDGGKGRRGGRLYHTMPHQQRQLVGADVIRSRPLPADEGYLPPKPVPRSRLRSTDPGEEGEEEDNDDDDDDDNSSTNARKTLPLPQQQQLLPESAKQPPPSTSTSAAAAGVAVKFRRQQMMKPSDPQSSFEGHEVLLFAGGGGGGVGERISPLAAGDSALLAATATATKTRAGERSSSEKEGPKLGFFDPAAVGGEAVAVAVPVSSALAALRMPAPGAVAAGSNKPTPPPKPKFKRDIKAVASQQEQFHPSHIFVGSGGDDSVEMEEPPFAKPSQQRVSFAESAAGDDKPASSASDQQRSDGREPLLMERQPSSDDPADRKPAATSAPPQPQPPAPPPSSSSSLKKQKTAVLTQTGRSLKKKKLALELVGAEGVLIPQSSASSSSGAAPAPASASAPRQDSKLSASTTVDDRTSVGTETLPRVTKATSAMASSAGKQTSSRAKSEERSMSGKGRKMTGSTERVYLDSCSSEASLSKLSRRNSQSSAKSMSLDLSFDDEEESGDVYPGCYQHFYWVYVGERRRVADEAGGEDAQQPAPGEADGGADWDSQAGDEKKSSLEEISSETKTIDECSSIISGGNGSTEGVLQRGRSPSVASTDSEKDFRRRYQAIAHRMVHRKASSEMYRRIQDRQFECDKTVVISRASGEFGFRIHGSRPVVVSAIEPGTPAETSGLEIGDIVIAINGVNVLDSSHPEVVRIAHSGSDVLKLDVARTRHVLTPVTEASDSQEDYRLLLEPIHAGYIYRRSDPTSAEAGGWHKRWFCLRGNRCLYYYKSEKDNQPIGALCVSGYSIEPLTGPAEEADGEDTDGEMQFAFTLSRPGSAPHKLAAASEAEMRVWLDALHAAADPGANDGWMSAQKLTLRGPPTDIKFPDCFGYLSKLGHRWRAWRRRYCVLKDAALYFYADTSAAGALGVACLHGYRVQSSGVGGKKHAFELVPPDENFRHFFFYTDSDTDKKRWFAALEFSIDRWLKVG